MAGKIALVTGASGGIGAACAEKLARQGYTVLAHANRGMDAAQALAARLCAEGCDVHAVQADLSDSAQAGAMCADILRVYHRVDALVLCAGVSHTGLLCDMTDAQWHAVMETNVSPGMTETSLFPAACKAGGLSLSAVLNELVSNAKERGAVFC